MDVALQRLLYAVEIKFGRPILDKGDCVALSNDIFNQTSQLVNYNTLRRLFGLAKQVRPRQSTLEILATYTGYESWNSLRNSSTRTREEEMLAVYHYFKSDDNTFAEKYASTLLRAEKGPKEMIAVALLFGNLLLEKQYDIVTKLLKNDYWRPFADNVINDATHVSFTSFVAPYFLAVTDEVLIKKWITDTYYAHIFLNFHVDLGDLDGNFGRHIRQLAIYGAEDERRFAHSLLAYQAALTNDHTSFLFHVDTLAALPEPNFTLHPPLLARIRLIHVLADQLADHHFVLSQASLSKLAAAARTASMGILYTHDTTSFLILTEQWEALHYWLQNALTTKIINQTNSRQEAYQLYAIGQAIVAIMHNDKRKYRQWMDISEGCITFLSHDSIVRRCTKKAQQYAAERW